MYNLHTEKQRRYFSEVIRLHYEEGYGEDRIAKIIPIGHSTVSRWIAIFAKEKGKVTMARNSHKVQAVSVEQTSVFEAAEKFARVEGILPAPESSHAIRVAIDEALKCKETGEAKNIVFGLTGTGYFDMVAYEKFNNGEMSDYIPTDEELAQSLAGLPVVE